jgi:hypothetical protein
VSLPRTPAGWTMAVFGILAVVLGAVGLLAPDAQLALLGFATPATRSPDDYTLVFLGASSMASFNMGVYYLLAAAREWRAFYLATVIFRPVTVTTFTLLVVVGPAPARFLAVAAWEGLGALATGVALVYEWRSSDRIVA